MAHEKHMKLPSKARKFLTFKDGKIGVNFGGNHAEAGLGGLLTGDAAHGGLSASAGTPYGQVAGAGLGGSLDGRTAGGLYAGASAGHGVGASAAIGGDLNADGVGIGGYKAESHAGSVSKKVVKVTGTQPESVKTVSYVDEAPPVDASYSKGFSATSSFNSQSSVNAGINGQSSVASTYNAQSPYGSVNSQSSVETNVETAPQQVHVQKFKKRLHHHHRLWPNHSKRFRGVHPQQQPQHTQTVNVQETVPQQPQIVYEERVVPKVVYEKRIVPQVVVEKKIVPETVIVQKTVQPVPATTTFTKQVQVEKRVETGVDVNKEVNVPAAVPAETHGTYGGSNYQTNYGLSGGYDHQAGSKLINDIFNIPIATLQAVNRLVSGSIDIQKTVTVNHS